MLLIALFVSLFPSLLLVGIIDTTGESAAQFIFTGASTILLFASYFATLIATLFNAIAHVGFYYDLRCRAEVFDLEKRITSLA